SSPFFSSVFLLHLLLPRVMEVGGGASPSGGSNGGAGGSDGGGQDHRPFSGGKKKMAARRPSKWPREEPEEAETEAELPSDSATESDDVMALERTPAAKKKMKRPKQKVSTPNPP